MGSPSPSTATWASASRGPTAPFTSLPSGPSSAAVAPEPCITGPSQSGQAFISVSSLSAAPTSTLQNPSTSLASTTNGEHSMTAMPAQQTVTVKQEDDAPTDGGLLAPGTPSNHTEGQTSGSVDLKANDRKKGTREKRVLPTRTRRLLPLWTESEQDEHLWAVSESAAPQHLISESTVFIVSSDPDHLKHATEINPDFANSGALDFLADPAVIRACREKELIETPEFKVRDDSTQMGKTRGGALRSEEDTSDAAYERRHKRGDNAEKRSRRMEKERLVRDRQKIRDRLEQYRMADVYQIMALHASRAKGSASSGAASIQGGEGSSTAPDDQSMSPEAAEQYRAELIEEATDRLARYDALLTEVVPAATQNGKKEEAEPSSGRAKGSSRGASTSQSETPARRKSQPAPSMANGERESPRSTPIVRLRRPPRTSEPGPSTPSASSPTQAGSPTIGTVVAELSRPNIHARTAGGRFAKKSAIGTVVQEAPRGKRASSAGSPEAKSPPGPSTAHKPRGLRPSELARKAAREEEKAKAAAAAGSSSHASASSSRQRTTRAVSRNESPPESSTAAAEFEHRRRSNRIGPSLAELEGSERKTKRLKLTLNRRPSSDSPNGQTASADTATNGDAKEKDNEADEESDVPMPSLLDATTAKFSAPKALTMAEAEAMMMKAFMSKGVAGAELMKSLQNTSRAGEQSSENGVEQSSADTSQDVEMTDETQDSVAPKTSENKDHPPTSGPDFPKASQRESDVSAETTSQARPSSSAQEHPQGTPLAGVASTTSVTIPSVAVANNNSVTSSPYAHFPGRTMAARQRAAADIPSRRASGRVAELTKGAFGERVPARVTVREDFDRALMQARYEWSVVVREDESGSEEEEESEDDVETFLVDVDAVSAEREQEAIQRRDIEHNASPLPATTP